MATAAILLRFGAGPRAAFAGRVWQWAIAAFKRRAQWNYSAFHLSRYNTPYRKVSAHALFAENRTFRLFF